LRFVHLAGGLGNQLFIWQFAHSLQEITRSTIIIFDCYDSEDVHQPLLKELKKYCSHSIWIIKLPSFMNPFVLYDFFGSRNKNKSLPGARSWRVYSPVDPSEVPSKEQMKRAILFRLYCQNADFVNRNFYLINIEIKELLRAYLDYKSSIKDLDLSQVVHMRRGDFKANLSTIGCLTNRYFENLISPNSSYVLHTDEELANSGGLAGGAAHIFDGSHSPWLVLAHGSAAKTFIGSNSTLSWWAAFLNNNENSRIFLPQPWNITESIIERSLKLDKASYVSSEFMAKEEFKE
jgi:hypothetical protein